MLLKSRLLFLSACLLQGIFNGLSQAQTVKAVNDTITLVPGIVKTVDLFANDIFPAGDSLQVTSINTGSDLINAVLVNKGIYSFKMNGWGNTGSFTGLYGMKDYTVNKSSTAHLIFYITDHSRDSLNINNISALFAAFGNHFQSPFRGAYFIVPKGSGKSTIFNSTFWIGGMGADDSLYLAAERYRQGPGISQAGMSPDFYAGPVMDSVNYSEIQDTLWNRLWNVRRSEIEYHKAHWSDPSYIPIESILTWPGNGNTALGELPVLAPFFDRNNNGIYEPLDGDYPNIRGDQALYFIFNDDRDIHYETNGRKMKVEIHGMAYAFDIPQDSAFNNTIFLNYKIYNRSQQTYNNTYIGIFTDLDIGFPGDDYIGSDVQRGSYMGYNGTPVDGTGQPYAYGANPPAQSVTILAGPYLDPDNIDNPSKDKYGNQLCNESINGTGFGDGVVDNERMGMRKFIYFNNSTSGVPYYMTDPRYAPEYYQYLRGIWEDKTHMIYGGNGNASSGGYGPACDFMFPGNSDSLNWGAGCNPPNGPVYWTEKTAHNAPGDRRGLASMGPFTFHPGDVQEVDIAFVFARDYTGSDSLPSVNKLGNMIDTIRQVFKTNILPNGQSFLGVNETSTGSQYSFTVFPNPANNLVNLRFNRGFNEPVSIRIMDNQGRPVRAGQATPGNLSYTLDISTLSPGFYFIQVAGSSIGTQTRKIVIIR